MLVVFLGPVERGRGRDLGDDWPPARLLLGMARCHCGFLLASVMIRDRRAVLAAVIQALAVAGGRIVDPPERLEQLRVADLGRVEPHLDRLGVAGAAPADPLVAGVGHMPAGTADSGPQHPVDLAEGPLDTPETARGEGRALGPIRAVALERRRRRWVGGGAPELEQVVVPSNLRANAAPASGIPAQAAPGRGQPPGMPRAGSALPRGSCATAGRYVFQELRNVASLADTVARNIGCRSIDGEY